MVWLARRASHKKGARGSHYFVYRRALWATIDYPEVYLQPTKTKSNFRFPIHWWCFQYQGALIRGNSIYRLCTALEMSWQIFYFFRQSSKLIVRLSPHHHLCILLFSIIHRQSRHSLHQWSKVSIIKLEDCWSHLVSIRQNRRNFQKILTFSSKSIFFGNHGAPRLPDKNVFWAKNGCHQWILHEKLYKNRKFHENLNIFYFSAYTDSQGKPGKTGYPKIYRYNGIAD